MCLPLSRSLARSFSLALSAASRAHTRTHFTSHKKKNIGVDRQERERGKKEEKGRPKLANFLHNHSFVSQNSQVLFVWIIPFLFL